MVGQGAHTDGFTAQPYFLCLVMKFVEADSGLATLLCLAVLLRCQRVFLQQRKGTDLKMFFFFFLGKTDLDICVAMFYQFNRHLIC